MPTNKTIEECWKNHCTFQGELISNLFPSLKSFLHLLKQLEEVKEMVEGQKDDVHTHNGESPSEGISCTRSEVLSDLLSALQEKKNNLTKEP